MTTKCLLLYLQLSILCIFSTPFLTAQETPDSVGISTNPRPGKGFNLERRLLKNTFDWMSPKLSPIDLSGPYASDPNFSSPYYQGGGNADLLFLAYGEDSDFYPEDGWELVQWGFGTLVNGANQVDPPYFAPTRQEPILVLYNRHSGMLHVFGTYDLNGGEFLETEIRFTRGSQFSELAEAQRDDYKTSALFSLTSPVAQPLDQQTTLTSMSSIFTFPDNNRQLIHASFPVAYDPCVCKNKGALRVFFNVVNFMDISLKGRTPSTSSFPAYFYNNLNSSAGSLFPNFLLSVFKDGNNIVQGGIQLETDVRRAFEDYKQELKEKLLDQQVAKVEYLEDVIEFGANRGEGTGAFTDPKNEVSKIGASLKSAAKGVKFYKSSLKLNRINSSQLNKTPAAMIRGGGSMAGIVSTGTRQFVSELAVPGSLGSSLANEYERPYYPLYNEELGTLALLETPTLEVAFEKGKDPKILNPQVCTGPNISGPPSYETAYNQELKFRLAGSVKYALNPAARIDLENSDISVALRIETIGGRGYTDYAPAGNMESVGIDENAYISPFVPVACLEDLTVYLQRQFQDCYPEGMQGPNPGDAGDVRAFLVFANTYLSTTTGRDGYPVVTQEIMHYPVNVRMVQHIENSTKIPFEVDIQGEISAPVKAWRRINIVGNISNSIPLSNVSITAGEEVNIEINVEIGPGFLVQEGTENLNDWGSPRLPYTPAQLNTYCNTQYRANQLSSQGLDYARGIRNTSVDEEAPTLGPDLVLEAIPNPFIEQTELTYTLPIEGLVTISIYDIQGREVIRVLERIFKEEGEHTITIDGNALTPGYYMVKVSTPTLQQTIKLSKL